METNDNIWKFGAGHHKVYITNSKAYKKIKVYLGIIRKMAKYLHGILLVKIRNYPK